LSSLDYTGVVIPRNHLLQLPSQDSVFETTGVNGLRRVLRTVLIAVPLLLVACDPGTTIRQVKSTDEASKGSTSPAPLIVLHVKPTSHIIGETLYFPEVKVTNSSGSPVTIANVELAVRSKTYANKPRRPETYPLTIQPGNNEILDVLFRLDDDDHLSSSWAAELWVHYRTGEKQQLARASVIGGRF
jgi:hypothetical protein